jgi:hypothetical protein
VLFSKDKSQSFEFFRSIDMKKISVFRIVLATSALLGCLNSAVMADGTETLGPPLDVTVQSGTGVVVAGAGMIDGGGAGVINLAVPVGTINQVLLYWEGQSEASTLDCADADMDDDEIAVNGTPVPGILIGGPTRFFASNGHVCSATFRADITAGGFVSAGNNTLAISGMDFTFANNGAGVLVIFDDGSTASAIEIRDGNDLAFVNFNPPLDTTVPQTFTFDPSDTERTAALDMFFSSVSGTTSAHGFRPSAVEVTIGVVTEVYDNLLDSFDGDEWDTVSLDIIIPAGADMLTVQALSVDNDPPEEESGEQLPASFAWNAASLSVPLPPPPGGGEGCTPGYWKNHLDAWVTYTPGTQFSDVFEDAFPGKTLRQVASQGGGGLKALGRHTVAALLNTTSAVDYDLTTPDVIDAFNAVYPGAKSDYNGLKGIFEGFNEQGCPLN